MKPQPINLKPQQLGSIMITLDVLGASATMDFEQITSSFFILFVSISGIIIYGNVINKVLVNKVSFYCQCATKTTIYMQEKSCTRANWLISCI